MPLFCIRTSDSSFFNSDESHYFILCPKWNNFFFSFRRNFFYSWEDIFFSLEEHFFITVPQVAACVYENFICKEHFFIEMSQVAACICKKKKKKLKKGANFSNFVFVFVPGRCPSCWISHYYGLILLTITVVKNLLEHFMKKNYKRLIK